MRPFDTRPATRCASLRQRGAGIIETMVGILIGLVVVLAVYQVFASAEGYKRLTTAQGRCAGHRLVCAIRARAEARQRR